MRWNLKNYMIRKREAEAKYRKAREQWTPYFVWWPAFIEDEWVWLEYAEKRWNPIRFLSDMTLVGGFYSYRLKNEN